MRAVFMTAPKPVMTAQPTSAALSAGMSRPQTSSCSSGSTACSAKHEMRP